MAFNMTAFVGGAASGVIDRIDDIERKSEKAKDKAYTKSEETRLYNRGQRDKKQAITNALASQLAVFFPPEYVKDIMSNGNAAAQYALSQGEYYDKNNMDPALNYRLSGGASVVKPKKPKDTFENGQSPGAMGGSLSGASVTSVGEVSESATAPVGLGGDTFRNRFTPRKQSKAYNTLAAMQVGLLNERVAAGTDPDLLADIDRREGLFLEQAKKVAEAERKSDGVTTEFFNPTQRADLIKAARTNARNLLEIQLDLAGQITSDLKGSNKASIADVRMLSKLMDRNNNIYKEDILAGEIASTARTTISDLNSFAQKKAPVLKYGYQSQAELNAAVRSGSIKDGDIFAVKVVVNVPAVEFSPATESSPAIQAANGYSIDSFIGGTYIGDDYKAALGRSDVFDEETGEKKFNAPNGFLFLPYAFDTSKIFKPFPQLTDEEIEEEKNPATGVKTRRQVGSN